MFRRSLIRGRDERLGEALNSLSTRTQEVAANLTRAWLKYCETSHYFFYKKLTPQCQ